MKLEELFVSYAKGVFKEESEVDNVSFLFVVVAEEKAETRREFSVTGLYLCKGLNSVRFPSTSRKITAKGRIMTSRRRLRTIDS